MLRESKTMKETGAYLDHVHPADLGGALVPLASHSLEKSKLVLSYVYAYNVQPTGSCHPAVRLCSASELNVG